jgi:hypothetical protein
MVAPDVLVVREPLWLLIEWPDGEKEPTKYALTTLAPTMSKKQIVRASRARRPRSQPQRLEAGEGPRRSARRRGCGLSESRDRVWRLLRIVVEHLVALSFVTPT